MEFRVPKIIVIAEQFIINILKNAQDNLKEKQIENSYIKITTNNNIISICYSRGNIFVFAL